MATATASDGSDPTPETTTVETAGALALDVVAHPVASVSPWWRRTALGLGALRVGLGVAALAVPETAGRLWIGDGATGRDKAVLVRALGGRDVALGAGVLLAARRGRTLRRWVVLGALSDFVDVLSTAAGFTELPKWRRWLVLGASGGAVATACVVAPNLADATG
ncbi:MAG: hypothetical protein ACRDWE_01460 [Acidimicrobiales bacterium]